MNYFLIRSYKSGSFRIQNFFDGLHISYFTFSVFIRWDRSEFVRFRWLNITLKDGLFTAYFYLSDALFPIIQNLTKKLQKRKLSNLGLGYGTAISPERTIMDDFLTKYLDGPIKEVCFDWIHEPWYVPFVVDWSHSHLSCRKRLKWNQNRAKRFKNEEQTMVIQTVFTVLTSEKRSLEAPWCLELIWSRPG